MAKYFSVDQIMLFVCTVSLLPLIGLSGGGDYNDIDCMTNYHYNTNALACDEVISLAEFLEGLGISDVNVTRMFCNPSIWNWNTSNGYFKPTKQTTFKCIPDENRVWHIMSIKIRGTGTASISAGRTTPDSSGGPIINSPPPTFDHLSSFKQLQSLIIRNVPLPSSTFYQLTTSTSGNLQELVLSDDSLTGSIPSYLDLWNKLTRLDLSSNYLDGPIPEALGNLSMLTRLDLHNNQLSGSIPSTLGDLSMLNVLDLSSNQLTGELPENLGKLSNLDGLLLNYNFFNGSPSVVGNLSSLRKLDLSNNNFSGKIPSSLGKLTALTYLGLDDNMFSGNIPEEVGDLKNLLHISFSANNITGPLPNALSKLTLLYDFIADGNYLTGSIPDYITNWTSIVFLDLLGNNFTGPIPAGIFHLPNLTKLWISDLHTDPFKLPDTAYLPSIEFLTLRNCSITGIIPASIAHWTNLLYLDLSFNLLEGNIPHSLNNTSLIWLLLTENKLNGSIPEWLTKLTTNETDLSFNNFTDESLIQNKIPGDQMNFTALPINLINDNIIKNMTSTCKQRATNTKIAINCGGAEVPNFERMNFEADESLLKHSTTERMNWAYTCSGQFISSGYNKSAFIQNKTCSTDLQNESLYKRARRCPEKLTYYGFCLSKGTYTVKLYFAEIAYANYFDYSILNKRVFDVYIQDKLILQDFNIKDRAGGPNKQFIYLYKDAEVTVEKPILKIQLVWRGKGSIYNNVFNGPLISAISVTRNFLLTTIQTAVVAIASMIGLALVAGFLWRTGIIGDRNTRRKVVELHDKAYSIKQLSAATRKYSDKKKIGHPGLFGTVYKAQFPDQKVLYAIKKLHPEFWEPQGNRIRQEFFILKRLDHENIVPLLDGYSTGDLNLLIYEYMEGGSLETALFDAEASPGSSSILQNNWKARLKVTEDVVKGLKYLHEDSTFRITHGDLKATNVLLDGSNPPTAKLSDFGLAKFYEEDNPFSITKDKRNIQYIATGQGATVPTVKADVYSFGILLFEIISGRRAMYYNDKKEAEYLLPKATQLSSEDRAEELVDSKLTNIEDRKEAASLVKLAIKCVDVVPDYRPTMSEVLAEVEYLKQEHNYSQAV